MTFPRRARHFTFLVILLSSGDLFSPRSQFPVFVFLSLCLTSRLVKTLLYNFIRQEKCPPPATHIFEPKDEGGLLYGLASGVASTCTRTLAQMEIKKRRYNRRVQCFCFSNLGNTLISPQLQLPRFEKANPVFFIWCFYLLITSKGQLT